MENSNYLEIDLRNATKSDLLNLSHNFRVISKIHDLSYSSNFIFILSIILAVIIGVSINLFISTIKFSEKAPLILLMIFSVIIILLIIFLILEMKKYNRRSKHLDNLADKILEDYFKKK